ncbi:MAG: hypothetical protein Q9202_003578 [Teloschistes flavicans]
MTELDQAAPLADMLHPPINRAMKILDRSFFRKDITLAAACILDVKKIARYQKDLSDDVLNIPRLPSVRSVLRDTLPHGRAKGLLLKPEIQVNDKSSWGPKLQELVETHEVLVAPYQLQLRYDYWTYPKMEQLISYPPSYQKMTKAKSRSLIASVLLDKNPTIRTVINKIDDVGEGNEFRTFKYEVLVGPDDMNVEVREQNCVFRFDYSQVYWNTRLSTEHHRLVSKFKEGEAVCDVMAGVGPFALPAAKKNVWVWANDLNPASYKSLVQNAIKNKILDFISPFCEDGHSFIRISATSLLNSNRQLTISSKVSRSARTPDRAVNTRIYQEPKTFAHYILNLPASATTFLPSFVGLYAGHEHLFEPHTGTRLPMVHVYCFSTKSDDNKAEEGKIYNEVSEQLGYRTGGVGKDEMEIWDVRDVAPQKRMFCASFRLPAEVAFRKVDAEVKPG